MAKGKCTLIKQRVKNLWLKIEKSKQSPSAFLVTNQKNIFYLTGFTGEGILLSTPEQNYLITDSRYTEQANREISDCRIITQDMKQDDAQTKSLRRLIDDLKIDDLGFESEALQVNLYLKYRNINPKIKLYPFQNIIEEMRMVKDADEIEMLIKSAKIATHSFTQTMNLLKSAVSELNISAYLNYKMRKNGAQKEAFDIIVTSGERTTLIHGNPTDKKINENELIIIDFGCIFEMYHSDCTRSLLLGNPNKKQKKIFDITKDTQIETLLQVKAGKKCCELDNYARKMIEKRGYGDYFSHSLGHGVGLDIHELPRLSPHDQTILQPGMVITIEPGIYVPEIGGIRIEDTVVVTENGCHILTNLPKGMSLSNYTKDIV